MRTRRLIVLAVPFLMTLVGCRGDFAGPLAVRHMDRADAPAPDGSRYTIDEQQTRGRQRYTIPDDDFRIGPRVGTGVMDPIGRGTFY